MSLLNSSEFNTNPACLGVGPSHIATDPYRTAQLIVFTITAAVIVASTFFYLWRRRNRRRLRNRSLVPLFIGSLLGTILMMIRVGYNYTGKEYFSCTLSTVLYYLIIPVLFAADWLAFIRYLHSMAIRQDVSSDTLKAVAMDKKTTTDHLGRASLKTWLIGMHNFLLFLLELYIPYARTVARYLWIREEKFRSVSKGRIASYEVVTVFLLALPYTIACTVRIRQEPSLMPENGCTGCPVLLTDWLITNLCFLFYIPVTVNFSYRHRDVPDSLSYRKDVKLAGIVGMFGFLGSILALIDPGSVMKSQQFDWFTFEMIVVVLFHCIRCILQLWRTARIHKLTEQHITLIEVLADGKGSLLFEKHLISELANENLLFWREAIKYKLAYDKNPDFEYSQQMAKVLFRTFIGRHAQLPINISDDLARSVEQRVKGTVSRSVFDEAICEVYRLLEGPFRRFVHSAAFKEYASTKADFSMSILMNPMAIVPSSGDDERVPVRQRFAIDDYVHSL